MKNLIFGRTRSTPVQLVRYLLVAGTAAVADTSCLYFLNAHLGVNPFWAAAAGFTLGLIINYLMSVAWVFESTGRIRREFVLFSLVGLGGLGWTELILWVTVNRAHVPVLPAKLIALCLVLIWNFGMRKTLVFNATDGTSERQTSWFGRARTLLNDRFNPLCLIAAFAWLGITVPLGILWRPTIPDFGQFYMAGIVARLGAWQALYPVPVTGSLDNAGLVMHSYAKPLWTYLSQLHGVWDYTHFILPPFSALLFVPLSYLDYSTAFWVWIGFLTACVWCTAFVAGRLSRELLGRPSRSEGVLALLIVMSPMTARAIRIANVSPPIALMIAVALLALVRRDHSTRAACAVLMGAMLKYATLILLPLLIATRRWKMLLWLCACGSLVLALTLEITGTAPFVEFYRHIVPTLSRPSWYPGNQALSGMLARIFGRPFTKPVLLFLTFARVWSLELIIAVLLLSRPERWRNPANVFAAAGLLIGWLLIFSPIAWEHWPLFLCPLWGWLLWEAQGSAPKRALAYASLGLMYWPAGIIQVTGIATFPIVLREPFNSSQLLGVVLFVTLACCRLLGVEPLPRGKNGAHAHPQALKRTIFHAENPASGESEPYQAA